MHYCTKLRDRRELLVAVSLPFLKASQLELVFVLLQFGRFFFFKLFFIEVIYVTRRGTRRWAMKKDAPAKSVALRVRDVWFELFVVCG